MKILKHVIISTVLGLGVLSLPAQEKLVLSLDSALSYAIGHNKTLVNSKFAIDKSTQKLKETIAAGLPQISASIDYNNFLGATASLQLNPAAPPAIIEFNPTSSFKANVSQLVFSGNYFVGIELSKLAKTITEQSYQKDELNVKEQTIQAYCMILATERILGIIRSNKENALVIYEKTQNLANAGIIEQTDVKKLSIMVASVDNALKSMQRQVELGYNLLRFQLGLNSDQAVTLSSNLDDISKQYILHTTLAEAFNIQNNIDFKLISMQGDIAEKSVKMRKSSYLPTLAAYYSRTDKILKPLFDFTPKNVVGLTLNVPILSGGTRLAQLNQARIDSDISSNTKELLTQQLTLQERQLRYNYNTLLDQYDMQQANVEIAKEVLEKMNLKYQQGIVSSLELTSANNDYLTSETNFTNIILQLLNAEMTLRKINSKL
jgi:outer membrane protein TolC